MCIMSTTTPSHQPILSYCNDTDQLGLKHNSQQFGANDNKEIMYLFLIDIIHPVSAHPIHLALYINNLSSSTL